MTCIQIVSTDLDDDLCKVTVATKGILKELQMFQSAEKKQEIFDSFTVKSEEKSW